MHTILHAYVLFSITSPDSSQWKQKNYLSFSIQTTVSEIAVTFLNKYKLHLWQNKL